MGASANEQATEAFGNSGGRRPHDARDAKRILHSDEYQVIGEAASGKNAIALCASHKPGLVLLYINMPKMDGLQASEQIRKISPATIVLMVNAEATMGVLEAILLGASGFVVKPLNQASVVLHAIWNLCQPK